MRTTWKPLRNKTNLTFLLSLTFLFLFSGSVYGQVEVEKRYWDNGKLKFEELLLEFDKIANGVLTDRYENGNKRIEVHTKDLKLDGVATEWYENGNKKVEQIFKNGKSDGVSTVWYESGEKMATIYLKNGKEDGVYTEWFKSGSKRYEGYWEDGKQEGVKTIWYESGKKKFKGNYRDGNLDGVGTVWYENGNKQVVVNYKNGNPDGVVTTWYESGEKQSVEHYKDGKLDGIVTGWDENGSKTVEKHYKNGKEDVLDGEGISDYIIFSGVLAGLCLLFYVPLTQNIDSTLWGIVGGVLVFHLTPAGEIVWTLLFSRPGLSFDSPGMSYSESATVGLFVFAGGVVELYVRLLWRKIRAR